MLNMNSNGSDSSLNSSSRSRPEDRRHRLLPPQDRGGGKDDRGPRSPRGGHHGNGTGPIMLASMTNGPPADEPTPHNGDSPSYADAVMNGIHSMAGLAVNSPAHDERRRPDPVPRRRPPQLPPLPPLPPHHHCQQEHPQPQHHHQYQQQQDRGQLTVLTVSPVSGAQPGGEGTAEGDAASNSNNIKTPSRMSIASAGRGADMSVDSNRTNTPTMSLDLNGANALDVGARSGGDGGDFAIQEVTLGEEGGEGRASRAGAGGGPVPSSSPEENGKRPGRAAWRGPADRANGDRATRARTMPAIAPKLSPPAPSVATATIARTASDVGREATAAHERELSGQRREITGAGRQTMQAGGIVAETTRASSFTKEFLRRPERTMERLSYVLGRGSLVMINFSQRNLGYQDAELIRSAILSNPQLSVLKLGYNNLGNIGANLIASAIQCGGDGSGVVGALNRSELDLESSEKKDDEFALEQNAQRQQRARSLRHRHHPSLSVLDLGFNNIGDEGCTSLARRAVSRNPALSTLYLSGNAVREGGALALAEVVAGGCALTSLHLTANRIGPQGVRGLMRSMAEFDVTMQMAHQDRENRLALKEERRRGTERKRTEERKRMGISDDDEEVDLESLGIKDEDDDEDEPPDDLARLRGFKCMEHLYLGGTNMESTGCLSVSNMLLTNLSLRTICLSDNGLNDQDLSLFSQSLSRNRELPLETLRLSFNKLTCAGVETLMNAIWGSECLREIKLDNNRIRDRGAQLAAVVLTSVNLESLDMGFNRLTIVGIKALMKSLAENRSLLALTLSGNVLDTNASKAVSYALAYNKTIQKLYVDHCSLSYAAQRHVAAGIVSNSNLALRVMSGFPLGAISVTLGLPGAMETWSNEQVLKFIRVMWDRHRHEKEVAALASCKTDSTHSMSTIGGGATASSHGSVNSNAATSASGKVQAEPKSGPSDPATVVAAAKSAFEALGDAGGALLLTEEPQRSISDSSPMVSSDAVMLEKTPSGTIRVPSLDDSDRGDNFFRQKKQQPQSQPHVPLEASDVHASSGSLCTANGKDCPETPVDPAAKRRNMDWLRLHFRSLNEMMQLPYVHADLLQLYRYFYSPADDGADGGDNGDGVVAREGMPPPTPRPGHRSVMGFGPGVVATAHRPSGTPPMMAKSPCGLQRKISYRGLHDVMMGRPGGRDLAPSPNFGLPENSSKRRPMAEDRSMQPATKRARNGKPRIDYFPRLKAKIEQHLSSSKQPKALVLLRQLKFVETTMFHGTNPYCDQQSSTAFAASTEPVATDAEVILIDML